MSYDIEVFNDNDLNANTYLISNETSCIIIDPANNLKILEKYINNKKVLGILITHGHYDHFKCLKELLKKHKNNGNANELIKEMEMIGIILKDVEKEE